MTKAAQADSGKKTLYLVPQTTKYLVFCKINNRYHCLRTFSYSYHHHRADPDGMELMSM